MSGQRVGYKLRGTMARAGSVYIAVRFNLAVEERMLKILERGVPKAFVEAAEREAAEQVMASGLFQCDETISNDQT